MKQYMKKHWFEYMYSAVLVCMAAVGISLVFGYVFSSNDDVMLRNIVNGNYTGTPDAHLIYIMYPLGFLLKSLYCITAEVSWYDCFMIGMHYLSWYMLLVRLGSLFAKKRHKAVFITLALGGLLIVDLPYVVMHQYTVLAALLAGVAIFWLATSRTESKKQYVFDRAIVILFLILCMWVRKQVFLLAVPLVCLSVFLEVLNGFSEKKVKKTLIQTTVFVVALVVPVAASLVADKIAYNQTEWKEFQSYNEARTDIYDFYGIPNYYEYENRYAALGLDAGDWLAIDGYNAKLVEELNADKLSDLAELSRSIWKEGFQYISIWRLMIYEAVETLYYNSVQPIGILLTVLYAAALVYCYKNDKKKEFVSVCIALLFEMAVIGYFLWQGRYPERVSYGFYFMQMMYLAGILLADRKEIKIFSRKNLFWICAWCAVLAVLCGSVGLYRVRTTLNERQELEQNYCKWKEINLYFQENEEKYYCIDTNSFVFATELMFESEKTEASNMIRLGTWVLNSPLEKEHDGGERDWFDRMINGQAYYVQDEQNGLERINEILLQKGYQKEAEVIDRIVTTDGGVYQIISLEQ